MDGSLGAVLRGELENIFDQQLGVVLVVSVE